MDLNLLATLDALLAERSVTRAARRLRLSQPAVSVQLAKLRDALGDPLLIPGPRGMTPTSVAIALEGPLRVALQQLGEVVAPARFSPETATITWRVAASDYSAHAVVLPRLAKLRAQAPRARLAIVQQSPLHIARQAELGEIDLAFVTRDNAPPNLKMRVLFSERYVLVGRRNHPALKRKPTPAQLGKLEFAIVSPEGGGFHTPADAALAKLGLARDVVLSVPHFTVLTAMVASSDLVALLPERLVQGARELAVVEPPLELAGFEMTMVWHERVHRDPAHAWLREQLQ